jgi:CysZ protein
MPSTFASLFYLIEGFKLIIKPGVKRYVAIPLFLNIILFVGLFFLARHFIHVFNIWFISHLPSWLHWLSSVLWLLFFLSFFLILIYTFVIFANLISAPFNSLLAEKVELLLTGKTIEQRSLFENIKDVPRIIGRQLAILGYYLPRAVIILILFLIPVIHFIAVIIWFLFNAWFLTLIYLDYPTDNHRIPLQQVKNWMRERRGVSLAFGISILIGTMIPILNLFVMPVSVAAATKFWIDSKSL